MKASEYLWKYCEMMDSNEGVSPEQIQGELRIFLGDEEIVSDSDGERLSEREAKSVFGRNEERLWEAYKEGNKPLFAAVCMYQQVSDDEWQKLKEEMWAKEDQDGEDTGDCQECQIPEAEQ